MSKFKEEVQKEILALLNENIDEEVEAMKRDYPVAIVAKEVLLSLSKPGKVINMHKIENFGGDTGVDADHQVKTNQTSQFMDIETAFQIVYDLAKKDVDENSDKEYQIALDTAHDFLVNNIYN